MIIEQVVMEKLRHLPGEQQQQVLDFVEFLETKHPPIKVPSKNIKGLWQDLNADITDDDIIQARRQIWGSLLHENI